MISRWRRRALIGFGILPIWCVLALLAAGGLAAGMGAYREARDELAAPAVAVLLKSNAQIEAVISRASGIAGIASVQLPSSRPVPLARNLSELLGGVNNRTIFLGVSRRVGTATLVEMALRIRTWSEVEEIDVDLRRRAAALARWELLSTALPAALVLGCLALSLTVSSAVRSVARETALLRGLEERLGARPAGWGAMILHGIVPLALVWAAVCVVWSLPLWPVECLPDTDTLATPLWWGLGALALLSGLLLGTIGGGKER